MFGEILNYFEKLRILAVSFIEKSWIILEIENFGSVIENWISNENKNLVLPEDVEKIFFPKDLIR